MLVPHWCGMGLETAPCSVVYANLTGASPGRPSLSTSNRCSNNHRNKGLGNAKIVLGHVKVVVWGPEK